MHARRSVTGFFDGLAYPLRGMRFVFVEHRWLVRYWVLPLVVVWTAMVTLAITLVRQRLLLIDWVWQLSPFDVSAGGLWVGVHTLLSWLLVVVAGALGTAFLLLSASVIAAPFNDALSAAVERIEGTLPAGGISVSGIAADFVRSIRVEAGKLLLYMVVMGPLVVLSLIAPPLGGPLLGSVGFLVTVTYVAVDYTDWPAARRSKAIRERVAWVRRHFAPLLGFGVAGWALLLVPGLNLVLMPAAVAGGTLLYLDLELSERVEAS